MYEHGHLTHTGLRRARNEDTYEANAALGLWLVADGIGGHEYGEVASALARDIITREVRATTPVVQAIRLAGEELLRQSRRRSDALPMGTTVVAAQLANQTARIAWVGDSRAYLWRQGQPLTQLTQDHSHVGELVAQGLMSEADARQHKARKMVTQALGVTEPAQLKIEETIHTLERGDVLLLCSDGLTEHVSDIAIARALGLGEMSAQEIADTLVAAALDGGGSDNVTVLVIRQM